MTHTSARARLFLVTLLAAATLLASPAPAAGSAVPADAAAVIEKHVAWLGGWEALDAVRDVTLAGTIRVSGLSGPLVVLARRDGWQRTDVDLKVMKSIETLAGSDAWERNASGQVEEMGRDKAASQRCALDRTFNSHFRGEGVVVSLAGREEKLGRAWTVVRFAYVDGDTYDLLVDPETGESIWSRSVADGRTTWTKLADLRMVSGLRLAFRQETEGETARQAQTVTWEKVTVNAGLADARFARPSMGASVVRIPAGRNATDWLAVDLYQKRWVYLRGEVNGVATDIVLDSGAGMTVLDSTLAKKLGLRMEGELEARGTGGNVGAGLVSGVTVKLAGMEIGPLSAAVIDLAGVGQRAGRPLPLILGKELFHALVVDLDYPGSRIRFLDTASFRYEGQGRKLELIPAEDGHKSLRLAIEGGEPVVVGLDTGQGGALSVYRHYADERGLLSGRPVSERRSGGVGGATTMKVATLRSVTIAGYELRNVPAAFQATDVRGAFDTKRQEGNLGAGILSRFRVVFDYSRMCLWLEPGPDLGAPFAKDKSGLVLQWADEALTVEFVAPGSPAAEAGWKGGEGIAALDGHIAGPEWWQTFTKWAEAKAGTEVRLTLADGTERRLVLKEYY
ncbi:MAG TPA: aspartyl protease family protein [Thermoanaerobaculia bacterium]|nr:aspartyl protease family protein [Thermoanaerobaculia bacterium]